MGAYTTIEECRKRLDEIEREQYKIEKIIQKEEEDDIFDDSLYKKIENLEDERNMLNERIQSIA